MVLDILSPNDPTTQRPGSLLAPLVRARRANYRGRERGRGRSHPLTPSPSHPLTVLALLLLAGCARETPLSAPVGAQSSVPVVAVQTVKPEVRDVARIISLPGDLVPWQEATLYAKVPGYLDRLLADKGDRVSAGQLLAVIRAPELGADAAQARQSYLGAEAAAQVSRTSARKNAEETGKARIVADRAREDYSQARALTAKAKSLLQQAEATVGRTQEQKIQAEAVVDEARAQEAKAAADLDSAKADQRLADVTFERYNSIYTKDQRLIAKQQVDEAESRAKSGSGKGSGGGGTGRGRPAEDAVRQAQVSVADRQIAEAQAGVEAAKLQVAVAEAQARSSKKQAEAAQRDITISRSQEDVSNEQARQARLQASAQRSAESRSTTLADYANIRSPLSGIVTRRHADPGAFIQTASASQNAAPSSLSRTWIL